MAAPEYPTDYISEDTGKSRIHRGHGLDRDVLAADVEHAQGWVAGEDGDLVVEEVWLHYVPRIKWCSNLDGFGCGSEGDWHGHWTQVRPSPGAEFTLARADRAARRAATPGGA